MFFSSNHHLNLCISIIDYAKNRNGDFMETMWILAKIGILYFLLIIILRFLGKREVGQLSIFDLVILLIIADIASIGIDNNEFFWYSILCVFLLAILQKLLSLIIVHISSLRGVVDGNPRVIIVDGKINYKNMKKELYTMDDLVFQMHQDHIMNIDEIRLGILETNGTLSLFRKTHFDSVSLPFIISGSFVKDALEYYDFDKKTIIKLFKDRKINVNRILYASYRDKEILYYYHLDKEEEISPNIIRLTKSDIED